MMPLTDVIFLLLIFLGELFLPFLIIAVQDSDDPERRRWGAKDFWWSALWLAAKCGIIRVAAFAALYLLTAFGLVFYVVTLLLMAPETTLLSLLFGPEYAFNPDYQVVFFSLVFVSSSVAGLIFVLITRVVSPTKRKER